MDGYTFYLYILGLGSVAHGSSCLMFATLPLAKMTMLYVSVLCCLIFISPLHIIVNACFKSRIFPYRRSKFPPKKVAVLSRWSFSYILWLFDLIAASDVTMWNLEPSLVSLTQPMCVTKCMVAVYLNGSWTNMFLNWITCAMTCLHCCLQEYLVQWHT